MKLSFVIPCYRSENTISKVITEIKSVVSERQGYEYEIICINDCSPDKVYSVLELLASEDTRIKVIDLSKNMVKHAAVLAGFLIASGEYVISLDDDYQSPICNLWMLLEPLEKDLCDVCTANYTLKKQSWWKKVGSNSR